MGRRSGRMVATLAFLGHLRVAGPALGCRQIDNSFDNNQGGVLTPKGRLVLSSGDSRGRFIGPVDRIIKAFLLSLFIGQTMRPLETKPSSDDLQFLRELIEAGSVAPVIDRTYPLSQTADAIRYLETGRARGKMVISVSAAPTT
jgi:NADPH:quinone reductase-like Zn-dependent oxidoreductase